MRFLPERNLIPFSTEALRDIVHQFKYQIFISKALKTIPK